jgi:iron complex transport system permease protein
MPGVMLLGATLALSADLITHLPWCRHFLHLNAVNGLIGAPIAIWFLRRQKICARWKADCLTVNN